jgi:DNA polymerase family A
VIKLKKKELKEAAELIKEYLMLNKRISQIESWMEAVGKDGRVHGKVITNGAVTGRMTHSSPNMAQIPNAGSIYGPECRECWTVEEGNVLDMSEQLLRETAKTAQTCILLTNELRGLLRETTQRHSSMPFSTELVMQRLEVSLEELLKMVQSSNQRFLDRHQHLQSSSRESASKQQKDGFPDLTEGVFGFDPSMRLSIRSSKAQAQS